MKNNSDDRKIGKYTVVSIFTGGGGLTIGFIESGFHVVLATDIEAEAYNTFNINYPCIPFINIDIRTITEKQIRNVIGQKNPDVLIGGPPCQGFSNMGDKSGSDPRNFLIEAYIKIVSWLNPSCVLMENVLGLRSLHNGMFFNKICNGLASIGYDIYSQVLDASDYGVPQKRRRLFILGTKLNLDYNFPLTSSIPIGNLISRRNVKEAIFDLIHHDGDVPNHSVLKHSQKVISRYMLIPEGGKLPSPDKLPLEIRRKNFGNTYERLNRNSPCSTLVPGNNAFPIHPILNRSLTPREAARIQSFPDYHIFTGSRAKQCQLVGNAVPPLLAAHIAKSIESHLMGIPIEGEPNSLICRRYQDINISMAITNKGRSHNSLSVVDLFSGSGGFVEGFKRTGYSVLLAADNDQNVELAHRKNFPDIPFIRADLAEPDIKMEIMKMLSGKKVNVLIGGPPCQGFSIFGSRRFINSRKFNPSDDSRNSLVDIFWEYVKLLEPEWVIMENVPGFTSLMNGYYFKNVIQIANNLGYRAETRVLNAADYGVPQIRRRFVLMATRTDLVIPWPKPKYFEKPREWQKPYRNVGEVLTDLDTKYAYDTYPNHNPPRHNPIVIERFSYIKEGKKLEPSILPERLRIGLKTGLEVNNFSHVFKRLDRTKPSTTMVPGHNAFPVHPWLNRTLTIREVARIQTFPDYHIFEGPIINQGLQVGNAFPCLMAQVIAERLERVIRNEWTPTTVTNLAKYSMLNVNRP